ncbi:phospholipase D-like protein [Flavobacterium cutihirudinis]|uniref:phospholipase D n=1 Tax=Flavobacterium cutihirudinis TaxID=1265740 RepID=A0A3D9FZC2_9FLAO|nr:phospholipase D-like domain-containing protein [Flavobacterium cutihirudinis]RED26325.1 phospholipase D-like protein [Flavobacterium cutihirudinis]
MNDLITNGTEIKQRIISEINNACQVIYLAMAWFTDRDIAMAIIEAKNRNLTIDIILSSNSQNETVKLMLKGAGIKVHAFETGDVRGIMHHKFCLIDNKISINGSYNYSINASNNNVENIQVSDDTKIYSQFLTEFERLRYNIDHNIGVNNTSHTPPQQIQLPQPLNIIDTFSQQLNNLVYSAAQINTDEYKKKGYEDSKENQGNIDIFRTEYNNIREEIKTYATDEGLSSKKNILTSNITNAFESAKANLEIEKQDKITIEKRNSELEKRQIKDKISELKAEKSILESGNQNTGEKGLLQINKEIEKNKIERRALEQSFVIKKFWTIGTILIIFALATFVFYLSIFFASAIYKVFFEGNIIRTSLEVGINPGIPQLVDANAIIKIFKQQGALFGFIATLFFLIPVLLSNLKILGSENKLLNNIMFWVGLLVFDILVSTMVAINTDEIKCLLVGQKSTMQIWEVVKHGEFYLIFTFGMFPLILTHFLIDFIIDAYKKSQREIVDAEKNKNIQSLDEEMLDLNVEKEYLLNKLKEKEDEINDNNFKILNLETEINNCENHINSKYSELQKQIKVIFDDFSAKILSGKIFTDVILDSVISAYKSGFVEHLPKYYATDEVTTRVKEIEQTTT